MTETELLKAVVAICQELGLSYHHCNDSRKCDGNGFPDLVVVGRNGVMFIELKTETGRTKPEQITWAKRLVYAGVSYAQWRPSQLISGDIRAALVSLNARKIEAA